MLKEQAKAEGIRNPDSPLWIIPSGTKKRIISRIRMSPRYRPALEEVHAILSLGVSYNRSLELSASLIQKGASPIPHSLTANDKKDKTRRGIRGEFLRVLSISNLITRFIRLE